MENNAKTLISKLDQYPHVQNNIIEKWGTSLCRDYLRGLIYNTSGRVTDYMKASGFPLDTINVIHDILELHNVTFPKFNGKPPNGKYFRWD